MKRQRQGKRDVFEEIAGLGEERQKGGKHRIGSEMSAAEAGRRNEG